MPDLSRLRAPRAEVRVPFGDETLTVGYRPGVFTGAFLEALEEELSLQQSLAALLTDWDLVDERGEPVPVTEEGLREVPLVVLREVSRAVMEDFFPNLRTAACSGSTW